MEAERTSGRLKQIALYLGLSMVAVLLVTMLWLALSAWLEMGRIHDQWNAVSVGTTISEVEGFKRFDQSLEQGIYPDQPAHVFRRRFSSQNSVITWEIACDASGTVIGKHRYD